MNIRKGLKRLNYFFLALVLIGTMINSAGNPGKIGENIVYFFIFVFCWMVFWMAVNWVIRGFTDKTKP